MKDPTPINFDPIGLKELAEILIKHHGVKEGLYEVSPEIAIVAGGVNFPGEKIPGVVLGIRSVKLQKAAAGSTLAVDAAACNPNKPKRARKAKAD